MSLSTFTQNVIIFWDMIQSFLNMEVLFPGLTLKAIAAGTFMLIISIVMLINIMGYLTFGGGKNDR